MDHAKRHDKLVNYIEQELQLYWVEMHNNNKAMYISINQVWFTKKTN